MIRNKSGTSVGGLRSNNWAKYIGGMLITKGVNVSWQVDAISSTVRGEMNVYLFVFAYIANSKGIGTL